MSYNREHIGNVKVKSGRLVLTDPENLAASDVQKIPQQAPRAAALVDDNGSGEILNGIAVAFNAPFKDGEHPVFVTRNDNGDITSVEIQLSEE